MLQIPFIEDAASQSLTIGKISRN